MNTESDDTKESQHYCVLDYLYRDAANWKTWGMVLLRGSLTVADLRRIESMLEAGEFFVPEQIGLESLTSARFSSTEGVSQNDHLWHEFKTIRVATTAEIVGLSVWGTTENLLELIDRIGKWNLASSPHYAAFANAISNSDVLDMTRNGGI